MQTAVVEARLSSHACAEIRVENGRIKIDEATDLPNGTELCWVPAAPLDDLQSDDLDDEERAELHQAIRDGFEDAKAGRKQKHVLGFALANDNSSGLLTLQPSENTRKIALR